jgi:putative two-component system response regulator
MNNNIRHKIIMVDDNKATLNQGRNMLKSFYEVYPAVSAAKLFEILENVIPDLILLDIEMPEVDGYEVIRRLKSDARFADIPVIFLTVKSDISSERKGFDLGAADYVSKPFSAPRLLKRIDNQLLIVQRTKALLVSQAALKNYAENLEIKVHQKTKEVLELQNAVIATITDLVEFRDGLTGGHVVRTRLYMKTLMDEMIREEIYREEISGWDMNFLLASAQLHDLGKIAISDLILNKPGKLTPEEFEIMKGHVQAGLEAIEKIINNTEEHAFLRHTVYIVGGHHEKWDGSGYPAGLKGENIPLEGRLMAIADVYDALISDRPYKDKCSHEKACEIIEEGAATHFDPVLIDVFRNVKGEFARIVQEIAR